MNTPRRTRSLHGSVLILVPMLLFSGLQLHAESRAAPAPSPLPSIITHGSRALPKIAITIDDGWVDDPELLDLLDQYNIRATVFIIGVIAKNRPEFVQDLIKRGHEVCSHSYSHPLLPFITDAQIRREILEGQKAVVSLGGSRLMYFRPPGGSLTSRVTKIIRKLGFRIILWDNDALGYSPSQTIEYRREFIRARARNGSIILAHFGPRLQCAEVLRPIIPELLAKGYQFVTISEMMADLERERRGEVLLPTPEPVAPPRPRRHP